jgi:aerobic-type carbon monoxide dehydrogenase small subunit (CoxS/CutS family)
LSFAVDTTNLSATTSLATFLRDTLRLTGTKVMCAQAGCGVCVVTAEYTDAATGESRTRSVNSVRKLLGFSISTDGSVYDFANDFLFWLVCC